MLVLKTDPAPYCIVKPETIIHGEPIQREVSQFAHISSYILIYCNFNRRKNLLMLSTMMTSEVCRKRWLRSKRYSSILYAIQKFTRQLAQSHVKVFYYTVIRVFIFLIKCQRVLWFVICIQLLHGT